MKRRQLFRSLFGTALLFFTLAQSAPADATFVVNDQSDAVDNNIGDGVCLATNGKCTLRAAIQEANAQYAAHPGTMYTITVPGGTIISDPKVYALTLTGSGEDNAATGDLDIKSNLLIQGTGTGALVSAAQLGDRVFHIIQPPSGPINVTFINIWIANGTGVNGSSDGRLGGGGLLIDNAGSVTLMDGRVVSNSVTIPSTQTGLGGGIFQNTRGGKLTLKNMLVGNNRLLGGDQSVGAGGGVFGFGALSVSDSTIVSNVVTFNALLGSSTSFSGEGGGIQISCCVGNDSLTLSNTAVLSNTVSVRGPTASAQFAFGGGVYGAAPLTITNSTVQGNLVQATGNVNNVQGGGVHADGALLMQKSTVTENRLLTASNASVIFAGGGVRVSSAGSILTSTITRNTIRIGSAFGGSGGGLSVGNTSNNANVLVDASSVEYNLASNGGGIETHSSNTELAVRNSVVDNNTGLTGGGILNTGILSLTNSTIYSNLSWNHGGGLYNNGTANVDNVTFNNNTADIDQDNAGDGGAIYVLNGATLFLHNSLLTGNTDDSPSGTHAPECFGDIISQDYNLIAQTPSPSVCNVIGSTGHNLIGIFPNVLSTTLQDNGGPTFTMALLPGSPAIDKGGSATDPVTGNPITTDQRGFSRPVDNPAIPNASGGDGSDIGAFEVQVPTVLANISTRLPVGTGDNVLIAGFIVTGSQNKKVIVRAIGPSLTLAGKLADPTLELRDGSGALLESNDNWVDSPNKQAILDSTIPPSNNLEAAIVRTLPANNSAYTAIVRGVNNGTGIGVVEAYDLDRSVNSKLANISTRGLVQTGDNVLIAGTIVLGQASQKVIIRAIGPSLSIAGKLANPTLELRDGNGTQLEANDDWVNSSNKQAIIDSTIPPSNDLESAIVRTLTPAAYTAIVRGVNNTTGIGVVEIYALQ